MTPLEVLSAVIQTGGRLTPNGDTITVEAPAPLPEELIALVREHKADLLVLLSQGHTTMVDKDPAGNVTPPVPKDLETYSPVWRCRHCGAVVPIVRLRWGYCDAPACDRARQLALAKPGKA